MATTGIFFCAIYLVVATVVLAPPPLIKESRNSPDGSGELPGHIRNPLDEGADAPKLADEGIFPAYDYNLFDGNINKVKDEDFDDESVPAKNNDKDEDKNFNNGEDEKKIDEDEKKIDENEVKIDEEEKVGEEEKKFDEEENEKVDEEENKFDKDEKKFDEENKFDKDEKIDEDEKKIDAEEKKFDDDEKKLDEEEMKIDEGEEKFDKDEKKFDEDKTKINEDESKINDEKKDEDDKNIDDSGEDVPFHGGLIFDTPFFNTRQVSKYFHQLEKALEHVFREAADEASFLNGTFANTTEEEVDIDGKKYLVQKSIIKGKDGDSSIYVEALSSIPKTNSTKGVSEL